MVVGLLVGTLVAALVIPDLESDGPVVASDQTPAAIADRVTGEPGAGDLGSSIPAGRDSTVGAGTPTSATDAVEAVVADGGSVAPTKLTATDVGVTETEVHLGFLLLDLAGASRLGIGFALADQEATWQAFVDEANAQGGIAGRRIVPHYRQYDPLSLDDMREACVYLTENVGVFAAFDLLSYSRDPQLCFAEQHDTPFVWAGEGYSEAFAARAPGRFFSVPMRRERMLRNLVELLHSEGRLQGKKIAILDADNPGDIEAVDDGLIPALAGHGYTVTHRATLPSASNLAGGSAQIPVEIQQMRAKDVDVVLLVVNAIQNNQFVSEADGQGYRPTYYTSDFSTGIFEGLQYPDSFDGTLGLTGKRLGEWRVGMTEPAIEAQCQEVHQRTAGTRYEWGTDDHTAVNYSCNAVRSFVQAARAAGPELTRDRLAAGWGAIGDYDFAGFGPGSFRPSKTDGVDRLRYVAYDTDCQCWKPAGDFVPMRH